MCANNGTCFQGQCLCDTATGYTGARCEVAPTPLDAVVLPTQFGACSVTCGDGVMVATTPCTPARFGGVPCPTVLTQTVPCSTGVTCGSPVDGGLSEWSEWGACNASCDATAASSRYVLGVSTRTRTCTNPTPTANGAPCSGATVDTGMLHPLLY